MFAVVGRFVCSCSLLVLLVSPSPLRADSSVPAAPVIPDSVRLSPDILARVQQMLVLSPTFRSQFRRVAEHTGLIVSATIDPGLVDRSYRARSTIRRYNSGLVVVMMTIGAGASVEEFIAHEFEHVLEHIEGVDLEGLARRRDAGVWYSGQGTIETRRATRAGRAVTDEMRGRGAHSDNLVE